MKKRSWEILQKLLTNGAQNIQVLAEEYDVSERTLRSDIRTINAVMEKLDMPRVSTNKAGEIFFDQQIDSETILEYLEKVNYYSYRMSAEERQSIIALILLKQRDYVSMDQLADLLFVSRVTIVSDIAVVRDGFEAANITLHSRAGKGILLEYEEIDARLCIVDILERYFVQLDSMSVIQSMLIAEIVSNVPMEVIVRELQYIEKEASVNLTDEGFWNIVFYLFVSINRAALLYSITDKFTEYHLHEMILAEEITTMPSCIASGLNSSCEQSALAHFVFLKDAYPASRDIEDYSELYAIVADFLYAISNCFDIQLYSDFVLFEFLVMHLKEVAERADRNASIENPFFDLVCEEYPDIFAAVKSNISIIERYFHCSISEHEMSFITMHISAAMERLNTIAPQFNVIIVCPGSMATGQLLSAQIEKHFNFNVVGIIPADHVLDVIELGMNIDFVISTVHLTQKRWPMLVVNGVLKTEDINKILTFVFGQYQHLQKQPTEKRQKLTDKIQNAMTLTKERGSFEELDSELRSTLKKYTQPEEENLDSPYLYQVLKPHAICHEKELAHWRAAIEKGGSILVEHAMTTEEYTKAMIENAEQHGSYFVIRKGIALAHAPSNDSVLASGMSLVLIQNGVEFGCEFNDPVHLLFCFCVKDSRNYLPMLTNLIAISDDSSLFDTLLCTRSGEDAHQVIKQRELKLHMDKDQSMASVLY